MLEHVTWTTPLMRAQDHIKQAGELFEFKRTREAMTELSLALEAIAEIQYHILTQKK